MDHLLLSPSPRTSHQSPGLLDGYPTRTSSMTSRISAGKISAHPASIATRCQDAENRAHSDFGAVARIKSCCGCCERYAAVVGLLLRPVGVRQRSQCVVEWTTDVERSCRLLFFEPAWSDCTVPAGNVAEFRGFNEDCFTGGGRGSRESGRITTTKSGADVQRSGGRQRRSSPCGIDP